MDTITIDGRYLVFFVVLIILFFVFLITTLNVWLENQDHRKARAWDNNKCKANFIDWLAGRISANPLFLRALVLASVPFIVIWMLIRYPNLFIKKAKTHFTKQFNSALDYLRK